MLDYLQHMEGGSDGGMEGGPGALWAAVVKSFFGHSYARHIVVSFWFCFVFTPPPIFLV